MFSLNLPLASIHITVSHGNFFFILLFTCVYIGHFSLLPPPPPSAPPPPPHFQAEPVLALFLILLKKRHKHNKEAKAVLLVELRLSI
jgi:hypothetical protein